MFGLPFFHNDKPADLDEIAANNAAIDAEIEEFHRQKQEWEKRHPNTEECDFVDESCYPRHPHSR